MSTCVFENSQLRGSTRLSFDEGLAWLRDMELPKKWVGTYKRKMVSKHTPITSKLAFVLRITFFAVYAVGVVVLFLSVPAVGVFYSYQVAARISLCDLALLVVTLHFHKMLPQYAPVAEWGLVSLQSYGWGNLPRGVRRRAKEIQAEVPCAEMYVDELRLEDKVLDPLLWVGYGGEWFCIARWE